MRYAISYEDDALKQPVLVLNVGTTRIATFAVQQHAEMVCSILNAHEELFAAVQTCLPLLHQLDCERQRAAESLQMSYNGMPELLTVETLIQKLGA